MASQASTDPATMISWHIAQLQRLFPETIQNGFWLAKTDKASRKIREKLGISTDPKYKANDPEQSIELFTEASSSRDKFIKIYREIQKGGHTAEKDRELRQQAIYAAVSALQGFHDHGSIHIKKFYDRDIPFNERMLAYRRWTRTLDNTIDIYAKLPHVLGDNFFELTKQAEDAQVQIRSDAIEELTLCDPIYAKAYSDYNIGSLTAEQVNTAHESAKTRITAEVLLHSIKRVNPKRTRQNDEFEVLEYQFPDDSDGGTIGVGKPLKHTANNRTYNCSRVVPATIAVVFGARAKAEAAIDDKQIDRDIRTQWLDSYQSVYGGKFSQISSLNKLFDKIKASPPGTTGIIYNAWVGTDGAHVSVVSNVGGIPCMIEGQTSAVITRNPRTGKFESFSRSLDDKTVLTSNYDPHSLTNIKYLEVQPEATFTELDRARKVTAKLHENYFEKNDDTVNFKDLSLRDKEERHYYVADPNASSRSRQPNSSADRGPGVKIGPPPGPAPTPRPDPPRPPMIGPPPGR